MCRISTTCSRSRSATNGQAPRGLSRSCICRNKSRDERTAQKIAETNRPLSNSSSSTGCAAGRIGQGCCQLEELGKGAVDSLGLTTALRGTSAFLLSRATLGDEECVRAGVRVHRE